MEEREFGQPVPVEFGDVFFHLGGYQLSNDCIFLVSFLKVAVKYRPKKSSYSFIV